MPLALAAYRHAVRTTTTTSSASSCVWVSDDLVREAFDRFASAVVLGSSRPAQARTGPHRLRRHASNVPGPLEARRRLVKRRFNSVSTNGSLQPGPPSSCHDIALLFGMPYGFLSPERSPLPEWTWQPPGPRLDDPKPASSLPAWLVPPEPPPHPANLEQFLRRMQPDRTPVVSIGDYHNQLLKVETTVQLLQLHTNLANATLQAPFCSFLAFDRLIFLHRRHSSVAQQTEPPPVSTGDLLRFAKDPRFEQTCGANVAVLADYLTEANSTVFERGILLDIIDTGLRQSLFSAQALAALFRLFNRPGRPALGLDSPSARHHNMRQVMLNNFERRLNEAHAEVLPPTKADLLNLNRLARALPTTRLTQAAALFTLDRVLYGLQTSNVTLPQVTLAIHKIGLLLETASGAIEKTPTLERLHDIWRVRLESPIEPATAIRLVESLLRITNLLPATRSSMAFTCDLIREHASFSTISAIDLQRPEMQAVVGQSLCRLLSHEKATNNTAKAESCGPLQTLLQEKGEDSTPSVPTLAQLFDLLPSVYLEQWVVQTPRILLAEYSKEHRKECVATINVWLNAVYRTKNHDWARRGRSKHPVWQSVFWQLSETLRPVDLPSIFFSIYGNPTSQIILDHWIRRELESLSLSQIRGKPTNTAKDLQRQPRQRLEFKQIANLYSRYTAITLNVLEPALEYWTLKTFPNMDILRAPTKPYLALLKTLQMFSLPFERTFSHLLELAFAAGRPAVVDSLVHFANRELEMPLNASDRRLVHAQIEKYQTTNPGRALGLVKADQSFNVSRNPDHILALISGSKSQVDYTAVLKLLWRSDPGARLPKGHPHRVRADCPLSRSRIDLMHEATLAFASNPRFSIPTAFQSVLHCIRYLLHHKAPLDARVSKACVVAGISRQWDDPAAKPIPRSRIAFCLKIVRYIEGKEAANAVLRHVYDREK